MANRDDERFDGWVDERIGSLAAGVVATPDAGVVLNRLRARHRVRCLAARRWIWSTSVAGVAGIALLCVPASRACVSQPGACLQRMLGTTVQKRPRVLSALPVDHENKPVVVAANLPHAASSRAKAAALVNFKSEGAADAPMSLEVYVDYDCIHCATFVRQVLPELRRQYVATGQLRLVWRDFPLPTHRFATLAARYVDAAGALGYYDAAMEQIFATREEWDVNGDVDGALATVLPAAIMARVRENVQTDTALDRGFEADRVAGEADHLNHTPFAVVVRNGKREPVEDLALSLELVKMWLEDSPRR